MIFEQGNLYHIFNQGNNRQRIFFNRANYLFFLEKIKRHVLPFADMLAWCLMPNHFHLMVHVNELELPIVDGGLGLCPGATLSRTRTKTSSRLPQSRTRTTTTIKTQSLQHSIGVMLASYTRAINKENDWTGSLFRSETKANCLTKNEKITRAWFVAQGVTSINIQEPQRQYPNICFNYINLNPVKHGLVKHCESWDFSSYREINRTTKPFLINRDRISEFGLKLLE
ncbi:MAG: hypothetical protein PHD06_02245 [Bacteroidales bacterium]|nr:hypothetical protein [Bacteroidales bacterium]MDY0196522.1 hypothetical protein [Tenuifilaceae bacterium]